MLNLSIITRSRQLYLDKFQKQIQIKSLAQLLAITLYGRRFFPYYVYNILGGLDADGECTVQGSLIFIQERARSIATTRSALLRGRTTARAAPPLP